MAAVWDWAKAICSAVECAPQAITATPATRSGNVAAHSSARAPPMDPPTTAWNLSMPSASASRASARTESRMVVKGKREPQGVPSGSNDDGPVVP